MGGGEFGVFGGYFFFDVGECKGVGDGGVLEISAGDFVVFIDEVGVGDFWWFVLIVLSITRNLSTAKFCTPQKVFLHFRKTPKTCLISPFSRIFGRGSDLFDQTRVYTSTLQQCKGIQTWQTIELTAIASR